MSDRPFVISIGYGDGRTRWIRDIHPESGSAGECSLTDEIVHAMVFNAVEAFTIQNIWRISDRPGSARVRLL